MSDFLAAEVLCYVSTIILLYSFLGSFFILILLIN